MDYLKRSGIASIALERPLRTTRCRNKDKDLFLTVLWARMPTTPSQGRYSLLGCFCGFRVYTTHELDRTHDHTIPGLNLPFGLLLEDHCDQGILWDPTLSAYTYAYDAAANTFTPYDSSIPTNWLYFTGAWGDEQYPTSDPRQREILGISLTAKYQSGPTGPIDKQLNRTNVCPTGETCIVSPVLTARKS